MRAVSGNGLCQYAICIECYDKNKPKWIRGAKGKAVWLSNRNSMINFVTEFTIFMQQVIPSGVAKHFITLKLGKVESLVTLAVRGSYSKLEGRIS